MSEALPEDPSVVQVHSNIRLAESLASRSGGDVPPERREELLQLLRNRLTIMNKAVQVGLLDRYIRICRKSSTNYPPLPITGIKACLYIIKVSTDKTDLSIKEKLATVIENWRIILEQEIGPAFAGSQSVWTCKALCQLTGRGQTPADQSTTNSGKRKRPQDMLNGAYDKFTPRSSPLPQRSRTSSSRVQDSGTLEDSPRHLAPSNLSSSKNTVKEIAIYTTPAPFEFNKPASMEIPTSHKQHLVKSYTDNPVKTVRTPPLHASSSAVTAHVPITPGTSYLLPSPSTEGSSALQKSKVNTPLCNTILSNGIDHKTGLQESSKSQSSTPSQGQISRVAQNINQPVKVVALAANNTALERNRGSQTVQVPSGSSVRPVTSAQINNWQQAFCLLDSTITDLLETMPLTSFVSLTNTSFYKPNPYSPSFEWTPPSVFAYTDPPGLSLTNIFPIVTVRPQPQPHSPHAKPECVPTHLPSRSSNLAPIESDSGKNVPVVSSFSPIAHESGAHGEQPTHESPGGPLLPPAASCSSVEPTTSHPLASSNQDNSIQPSPQQPSQLPEDVPVEPLPVFNVTEAQKMKFVNTYRRVDASGKAKLEATLRMNKLWDVLAPLLNPSSPETLSTHTPQSIPPAPQPSINAALTHPNVTTTPELISARKNSPASTADKSNHVPAVVSPKQHVTCLPDSEPSQIFPESVTSKPFETSFDPALINNATPSKEGSLVPTLVKMISAMLAAEPQAITVIMDAFETLGVHNQVVILDHLNALAVSTQNGNDTFWQLRTQTGPAWPTTALVDPYFVATHPNTIPKLVVPMTTPNPRTEVAPQPPDNPLPESTAEKSAPMAIVQPSHLSEKLGVLSRPQVVPPSEMREARSRETPKQSTSKMDGAGSETGDEIEIINVANPEANQAADVGDLESEKTTSVGDLDRNQPASISRRVDTPANDHPSRTRRSPKKLKAPSVETRRSRGPSPLGTTKTPQGRLYFNILDDGLPGFPDADPAVQITGSPVRILARYAPDEQMPPIRTFVPLLKKV